MPELSNYILKYENKETFCKKLSFLSSKLRQNSTTSIFYYIAKMQHRWRENTIE